MSEQSVRALHEQANYISTLKARIAALIAERDDAVALLRRWKDSAGERPSAGPYTDTAVFLARLAPPAPPTLVASSEPLYGTYYERPGVAVKVVDGCAVAPPATKPEGT